ncbi:MAG: cysteine protease StiP family protein [Oribacterium sp.]|nr:cysteine protease StiP family protein [Oribacterium sp.]
MNSSFLEEDVTLLLKDITGLVDPLPTEEREKRIQSGTHYSEMLPLEYRPTEDYIRIYEASLVVFGQNTADAIARVSNKIVREKGSKVVIVSLARAGTPLGILIRRYIRKKYGFECPHYSISIIRDRGIDRNAVNYIVERHGAECIQFVDGWTGKGAIYNELKKELKSFEGIQDSLAVLADPAGLTELCGTHDDIMIPSSCLNCTVSGLISRTFLRSDIIGKDDFHGAAFYGDLRPEDRTYEFIDYIESMFDYEIEPDNKILASNGMEDVKKLAKMFDIRNINYIKPGIGETTRVLLRRIPWKVVIDERYKKSRELDHIRQLSFEKNVEIEYVHLNNYKCCGLIKQLADI